MRFAIAVLALTLAACKGPEIADPLVGQSFFLCCNLHYEKPEKVMDVNYSQGTLVPFGTRVQVLRVRKGSVEFQPEGQPPITLFLRYGRKELTMDTLMSRLFVTGDPRLRLRTPVPTPTSKRRHKQVDPGEAKRREQIREQIEQSIVEPGMTRDEVLMAVGYPPAHRTPSLDSPEWHYWKNRWQEYVVWFDGDKVSRVQQ